MFVLSTVLGLAAACAAEPITATATPPAPTSYTAWYGETCFEDEAGAPLSEQVAAFRRPGATWATREYTDARGCMPSAGLVEGLYAVSIEGRAGEHEVYVADGDAIRVRLAGAHAGVEYENGPSLSATIVELVQAKNAPDAQRRRVIDSALRRPSGTRVHTVGLLASFELRGEWARGGEVVCDNHRADDARALLAGVASDSPWLAVWPTAPLCAASTLGYAPSEHPVVREMIDRDPAGPVAANLWLLELEAARARGDHERADQIEVFLARVPAFEPYLAMASRP